MDSTTKIIELASQNNGIVTAAMISSAGISRGSLKYLADTGRLDQVSRGVYTLPEVWEDEFVSIQERYKRGVFSPFLLTMTSHLHSKALVKSGRVMNILDTA